MNSIFATLKGVPHRIISTPFVADNPNRTRAI